MRLLVIDNYDSFTYNLVQYFGELLAEVDVFRNDAILVQDIDTSNYNGVVISPGPCDPTRAGISLEVIEKLKGIIPILGVCLGHQCIGQSFGGESEPHFQQRPPRAFHFDEIEQSAHWGGADITRASINPLPRTSLITLGY